MAHPWSKLNDTWGNESWHFSEWNKRLWSFKALFSRTHINTHTDPDTDRCMLKSRFKAREVYYEICIVMVIVTLWNCFKVRLLLFIGCHSWSLLVLSQTLQKAKSVDVCEKIEIDRKWYTEGKKRIKVFVHRKAWDYRSRKEICSIWSNPSFMSSFDTESLFLFLCPRMKKIRY